MLQRVLRLQSFLASLQDPPVSLGVLAYRAGYADQSHLNREAIALAGTTPAALRAVRASDVRNVQDPV